MLTTTDVEARLSRPSSYEADLLALLGEHAEPHALTLLRTEAAGTLIEIPVSMDAVTVLVRDVTGEVLRWRPSVSAAVAQRYADRIGAMLITPRVSDLLHDQARTRIEPQTMPVSASVAASLEHSRRCAVALDVENPRWRDRLVDGVGKHWVVTNTLELRPRNTACNYGWYSERAPYVSPSGKRMWQTMGWRHDLHHWDYSQTLRVMGASVRVGSDWVPTIDVAADPKLCSALSSEGVLRVTRQPWIEGDAHPAPMAPPPGGLLVHRRVLHRGMAPAPDDVRNWQAFLGVPADGVFGRGTEAATRQFQAARGLVADGKVGPRTIEAANEEITARLAEAAVPGGPVVRSSDLVSAFRQAKTYRVVPGRKIRLIVIHTAEIAEVATAAESLMNWAAGPNAPKASWHFAVDSDSITQSVRVQDQAAHAPGVNEISIGIELCGRAAQTTEQWGDDYSRAVLDRAVRLVAALCAEHGIPAQVVDVAGLLRGETGITTHAAVSRAFKRSTHTDPGVGFPMDRFVADVRLHMR